MLAPPDVTSMKVAIGSFRNSGIVISLPDMASIASRFARYS